MSEKEQGSSHHPSVVKKASSPAITICVVEARVVAASRRVRKVQVVPGRCRTRHLSMVEAREPWNRASAVVGLENTIYTLDEGHVGVDRSRPLAGLVSVLCT